jgi:hypothetical protein
MMTERVCQSQAALQVPRFCQPGSVLMTSQYGSEAIVVKGDDNQKRSDRRAVLKWRRIFALLCPTARLTNFNISGGARRQ